MTEIRNKIVIKEKETANIPAKNLLATLSWKTSVDLDLYAFWKTKDGKTGKVFYGQKSGLGGQIKLDADAGVGDSGGDNEENMNIIHLDDIVHIVIAANIYGKSNANFAEFNSKVTIKTDQQEFEVPLTSKVGGSWAVIAWLDNTNPISTQLTNVNTVQRQEPTVAQVIGDEPAPPPERRGFLSRAFGG